MLAVGSIKFIYVTHNNSVASLPEARSLQAATQCESHAFNGYQATNQRWTLINLFMHYENMNIKVVLTSNKAARQGGTLHKFRKVKDCMINLEGNNLYLQANILCDVRYSFVNLLTFFCLPRH